MIFGKDMSTLRKLMLLKAATGGAPLNEYEASGNPLTFNTNKAKPLRSVLASWLPHQSGSGDPSPENIRPVVGMDGVTLWQTGKNLIFNDTISAEGNQFFLCASSTSYPFHLKPGKYTLSHEGKKAFAYYQKVGGSGTLIHGNTVDYGTFTIAEEADYRIWYYTSGATASDFTNVQLEVGESATSYEAPQVGTSYSVAFPVMGNNILKPYPFTVTRADATFECNADGSVHITGDVQGRRYMTLPDEAFITLPPGNYIFSYNSVPNVQAYIAGRSGTISASNGKFTLTEDTEIKLQVLVKAGGEIDAVIYPMLNVGSTARPYEPYTNTVYGGTLDLVSGVLTASWKRITLSGSVGWGENAKTSAQIMFTSESQTGDSVSVTNADTEIRCKSDKLKGAPASVATTGARSDYDVAIISNHRIYVVMPLSETPTVTDFKTWLSENEVTVAYELATPVILATLTPTQISALLGNNTMWASADNLSVTYLKKG